MDFCNDVPDRETWGNCTKLDLYSKNIYMPTVKVTNWEKYGESLPIDVDPYCPSAFNLHYSHYNKIGGSNAPISYTTTTQDMLSQIYTRRPELEVNPNKALINLYSNIDDVSENETQKICAYEPDLITTMQHSFQPPYPYLLRRLTMAEPPYFLHRFLKEEKFSKFLDDEHVSHTQKLQMFKGRKHISYNPCTGYYTDGTVGGDISDMY